MSILRSYKAIVSWWLVALAVATLGTFWLSHDARESASNEIAQLESVSTQNNQAQIYELKLLAEDPFFSFWDNAIPIYLVLIAGALLAIKPLLIGLKWSGGKLQTIFANSYRELSSSLTRMSSYQRYLLLVVTSILVAFLVLIALIAKSL